MINKLLFRNQDYKQLFIAVIGGVVGLLFFIGSIHYLIRINEYGEGSEALGANVLVIQKKITNANLFSLNSNEFDLKEIRAIEDQGFVKAVQAIQTNNFDVWLETNSDLVPVFKTDAFLQSISTEFIDYRTEDWIWDSEKSFVPIIMPRDFLIMLNTFMSASGMPQISDEIALSIPFRLRISNDSLKEWKDARVIGFTNQLSALLVPEEFMFYANQKFSDSPNKFSQLMVKSEDGQFGELEGFLNENGYEPKATQMIVVRLKSFVSSLIYTILIISLAALLGSILIFVQYIQLLIYNNKYEVRTLLRLGYSIKEISSHFLIYFSLIFFVLTFSSFCFFILLKKSIDAYFYQAGIAIEQAVVFQVFSTLIFTFGVFVLISYFNAKKAIRVQFEE